MTLLAIAIAAPDTDSAIVALHRAASVADLAELRLDLMQTFDLPRLLAERPLPVIVTCRPRREGGAWQGSEAARLAVLRQAAALGAEYVDLEWDCAAEAVFLDRSRTRLILSRHDFAGMPVDLEAQADQLWAAGADVVKVVGTARRLADVAPVLRLLDRATRPTIAIAMGACGLATRLLAFRYPRAFLSFAAPDPPAAADGSPATGTAPGQITASAMLDLYRVRTIDEQTRLIGLIDPQANGEPTVVEGNVWLAQQRKNALLAPLQLAPTESPDVALSELRAVLPLCACLSHLSHPVILSGSASQLSPARASSEESPPPPPSVILSGSAPQLSPAPTSSEESPLPPLSVILSGSAPQLSPARASSEESPPPPPSVILSGSAPQPSPAPTSSEESRTTSQFEILRFAQNDRMQTASLVAGLRWLLGEEGDSARA